MNSSFLLTALFFLTGCFFVSAISISLTTITYFLSFFLFIFSGDWTARWQRLKSNKAALSFWLIGALFIIGIFYSTATKHLIFHDLQKRHWLFMTPLFIVMLTSDVWRRRMQNAFLFAMIITLLIAFAQSLFNFELSSFIYRMRIHRGADVFSDHIIQSMAMNIAAFICAYRFLFEKKYNVIYAILFLLMGMDIIFLSAGRTGYFIFLLLLCYLGLIRFGWKGVLSAGMLCVMIIAIAFFVSNSFQTRIKNFYTHYRDYNQIHYVTSIGQRLEMYHVAEKMIRHRPWFGYGTGGIQTAVPAIIPPNERIFNPKIDFVESIYLNFLLEFGFFGLIVLFIAIAMQIKTTFELPHQYRCLMQFVLIAVLFGGIFNSFFVSFAVAHLYALFSALCFSSKDMINRTLNTLVEK
jgi:O-antigen ligase